MEQKYLVEAVHRVAVICAAFDDAHRDYDMAALAERCAIPQRTLVRIVTTLVRRDLLLRRPDGRLSLGPRWLSLSRAKIERTNIREIAAAVMRDLRATLDETYILGVRHGSNRLICECQVSAQPIRRMSFVGFETPLHVGSGGRAIMSRMSDDEVDTYLAGAVLENVGYDTVTDPKRIRADITKARRDGFLTSKAEITQESFSCSAPVLDQAGKVVASFTITLPLIRLTRDLEGRAVMAARAGAQRISEALGHVDS